MASMSSVWGTTSKLQNACILHTLQPTFAFWHSGFISPALPMFFLHYRLIFLLLFYITSEKKLHWICSHLFKGTNLNSMKV